MLSFKINTDAEPLQLGSKKYRVKQLDEQKQNLDNAKSQLDIQYKNPRFSKFWRECDPFKNEKEVIARIGNTFNVSNAWLKCYEILIYYDLIPNETKTENYIHFDNAAFPGSFIISAHHLIITRKELRGKYRWYGSSLMDVTEQDKEPLEDKYKLLRNYPKNWLMNQHNNGDVLSASNQKDFRKQIGGTVDLYTSDLGFDVSSDYNNQELMQAPANIGQILSGLLTLRVGGCFITKQYTVFEPITLSVMYLTASFFDEFYLCKPQTSREANSETYLVGKGFKGLGDREMDHPYIVALFEKIAAGDTFTTPIIDAKYYPANYIKDIIRASRQITVKQIDKINEDIARVQDCISSMHRGSPSDHPVIVQFMRKSESYIMDWYRANRILPIKSSDRLQMTDIFKQSI